MFRRNFVAGAAVVAGLLAFSLPSHSQSPEIRVGALLALSGPASFYGDSQDKALKIVAERYAKRGGIQGHALKVITYDTEGNSAKAAQLFRRLVESDKVHVIFGPSTSGESLPLVPIANETRIPMISLGAAEAITSPVTRFVFKIPPVDRVAAAHVLGEMAKRGVRKLAVIRTSDAFGQAGETTLRAQVAKSGMTLAGLEQFGPRDTSVTAQMVRLRDANPDALLIWASSPGPVIVLKEAAALGFKKPVYNSYGAASQQLLAQTGPAAEGSFLSTQKLIAPEVLADGDPQKAVAVALVADYKKRYGSEPPVFAAHTLDAFLLLEEALKNLRGPVSSQALAEALETVSVCGANGCFRMSPADHNGLDINALTLLQASKGRWVLPRE